MDNKEIDILKNINNNLSQLNNNIESLKNYHFIMENMLLRDSIANTMASQITNTKTNSFYSDYSNRMHILNSYLNTLFSVKNNLK